MLVEIITPDSTLFSGEASLVQLPGIDGSFEILEHHAPLVSILQKGNIRLVVENKAEKTFEIKGGVIEVLKNKVLILAE
ncbi:MAG: ATP synthase F1 subunit epsilon [Bacteroidota bacterium]